MPIACLPANPLGADTSFGRWPMRDDEWFACKALVANPDDLGIGHLGAYETWETRVLCLKRACWPLNWQFFGGRRASQPLSRLANPPSRAQKGKH